MTATMTKFYTVTEAAERLGVHPNTVRRLITRGELACTRIGKRWIRISEDDILDFLSRVHQDAVVPQQRHRRERPAS